MMDLRRLRAFVTLAEEGSVTRAAERLGMQQPQLTRLLRAMEAEFGTALMERLPRGIRPTEAGAALLNEARQVIVKVDGLRAVVGKAARGEQGRLAIGFTGSAALHPLVPRTLRQFRMALPAVSVTLEEATAQELVEALLRERIDAAFVRSDIIDMPEVRMESILDEPMLAALPPGHPLAREDGQPLPLACLAAESFVLYHRPTQSGLHDPIIAACRAAGFDPVVVQEAPRLPSTLSLVAAGFGVSLVPASIRDQAPRVVTFHALAECSGLSVPLRFATRRTSTSGPLLRFREMVRQVQRDEGSSG
ncbi:LysR family transcriptional regulator [Roseomonas ludipueritiae]|uniref:LysR family transcriptional regulator n=1 Tax=Pseudoroseomonas ludipueritiae TaxID=198093 RepID=A0ABR7R6E8_9PROT|nr:LysR family transcriptional regulator [Pseudoroseomonas ludipueritiae]